MRRWFVTSIMGIGLLAFTLLPGTAIAARRTAVAEFAHVGNNHIRGHVVLRQLTGGGTAIKVIAIGLKPGHTYISLYYGNDECALEPYSEEDVIGGEYTAHNTGVGRTSGEADDDLDEIHSVSVRDADTFKLLACAVVSTDEN
jgi:tRNA A37 threonylcarbamoyltransferase TsaD